jgi:hypothetical protein
VLPRQRAGGREQEETQARDDHRPLVQKSQREALWSMPWIRVATNPAARAAAAASAVNRAQRKVDGIPPPGAAPSVFQVLLGHAKPETIRRSTAVPPGAQPDVHRDVEGSSGGGFIAPGSEWQLSMVA